MTDFTLNRITLVPPREETTAKLSPIPFSAGLDPRPIPRSGAMVKLPKVDTVIMAYTSAEKMALADVLSPGVEYSQWSPFTDRWSYYEKHLTGRSPAREAKCAAKVCLTRIGDQLVLLVGCNLHLSTDDETIPLKDLVTHIVEAAQPSLFIPTGTAGGVGQGEVVGDVCVCNAAKMNAAKSQWEHMPWAQQRYESPDAPKLSADMLDLVPTLWAANAGHLSRDADRAPRFWTGDVETVPVFAFADTDDEFGVHANDPQAVVEEMDDACVAAALEPIGTPWISVRNVSDPQMGTGPIAEQKKEAEEIYVHDGYWTSVNSAIAAWAFAAQRARAAE